MALNKKKIEKKVVSAVTDETTLYPAGFAEADEDALATFLQTISPIAPVVQVSPIKKIILEETAQVTEDLLETIDAPVETQAILEQVVAPNLPEVEKIDSSLTLAAYLGYDPDAVKIEIIERLQEPVVPNPEEVQDAFNTAPVPVVIECPNCHCVDASRETLNTRQYPVHRRTCDICGFAFGWNELEQEAFE
jgi:hypothetical protein|tara:strand:- start:2095 stop:2670 length:576 start_codon:yes stop_codon:yes gene_type:complete